MRFNRNVSFQVLELSTKTSNILIKNGDLIIVGIYAISY